MLILRLVNYYSSFKITMLHQLFISQISDFVVKKKKLKKKKKKKKTYLTGKVIKV